MPDRLAAIRLHAILMLLLLGAGARADDMAMSVSPAAVDTRPVIAIIIDDLGHTGKLGRRALALPGPVAASILPHTPHATEFAHTAHLRGKEVLLHQPMQAASRNDLLGPGALTDRQTEAQLREQLYENVASIPHVSGVNNHMGSVLTRHTRAMVWLMRALRDMPREDGPLFFIDSVTTGASVAHTVAGAARLPTARRHVFLDHVQTREHVWRQVDELKRYAGSNGFALGIAHPYPETLDVLEAALPDLAASGYRLVSVRELIRIRNAALGISESVAGAVAPGTYRQK
ncbi:MAG: divergent polysaccharide deacetylase family protein [Pseudomonadota bacterium]